MTTKGDEMSKDLLVLADEYAAATATFARALALKGEADSMSPIARKAGDKRAVLAEALAARAIIAAHTAKAVDGLEPVGYVSQHNVKGPYEWQFNKTSGDVYKDTALSIDAVYTADQLAAAITTRDQRIAELENECKAWALTVDNLEAKQCPTAPQTAT